MAHLPMRSIIAIFLCGLCLTLASETTSAERKPKQVLLSTSPGMAAQDTLEDRQATVQEIKARIDDQPNESECSGRLTNVARIAHGGTCLASSEWGSGNLCQLAIDGNIHTEWASRGQGVGAWLRIWFARPSVVRLVRIMQRYARHEQFKEVLLEFSDGSAQKFTLTLRTGSTAGDIRGRWWDSFATNPTLSQFLKIEAVSVYTLKDNGIREVEVWANEQ